MREMDDKFQSNDIKIVSSGPKDVWQVHFSCLFSYVLVSGSLLFDECQVFRGIRNIFLVADIFFLVS